MTSPAGPPGYPPYGPPPVPPYGGGPPRPSSGSRVVTSVLALLFVAATVITAVVVNSQDSPSRAGSRASGAVPQSGGVPGAGGASYSAPVTSVPVPTPTTSSYVPPTPTPTPTRPPMDGETINRTYEVYMNALLNRSLSQLKSATCPRLRKTETGTALDHKYINRYQGHEYRIYDNLDYVIIPTTVRYVDPNTGGNGKTHHYSWYVVRYPDGHYWVCGIT